MTKIFMEGFELTDFNTEGIIVRSSCKCIVTIETKLTNYITGCDLEPGHTCPHHAIINLIENDYDMSMVIEWTT